MKQWLTFWRGVAALVLAFGLYATFVRFVHGLGASTNLSDGFPWGIWIGFDVLVGVGLAAGGFTLTAAVHIFNLERFKPIVRPTVLTAFLGYLLVIVGLFFDLGQPWRIWHPIIMWNPHSVMFEVGWCVTLYTTVLALEFSPMLLERFDLQKPLRIVKAITIPVVILGVVLSTLHQSSLGTLFVIVPDKLHGLWYSPLLPLFFFISAIAGGLAMVIVESSISSRVFGRRLELDLLQDLGRVIVVVLGIYLVVKLQDMSGHDTFYLLAVPGPERFLFMVELFFGALVPMVLLAIPAVRRDAGGLFCSALLVVLGFVTGRLNIALTGVQGSMQADYFPSVLEFAVTAMLIVLGFIAFTLAVKHLNVFPEKEKEAGYPSISPAAEPNRLAIYASRGSLAVLAVVLFIGGLTLEFGRPTASRAEPVPQSPAPLDYATDLRLPDDLVFPPSDDSPGEVIFSHDIHVETDPPNCTVCHASTFPLLRSTGTPRIRGEQLHDPARCGSCHDGEGAFSLEDDCESCHVE
jgi:c(7)-type cytochrome triheme protein